MFRALLPAVLFLAPFPAQSATILVLRFHNTSQFSDLNWVGESIANFTRPLAEKASAVPLETTPVITRTD